MLKLGRNDPCHCGSGKKYKKCHLAEDERERLLDARANGDLPLDEEEQLLTLLREAPDTVLQGADLEAFRAKARPVVECLERRAEIEQACAALRPYQEEFQKLLDDRQAFSSRAESLFAEDVFAPMRFTAEEVSGALEAVGAPNESGKSETGVQKHFAQDIQKVIKTLADKDRRSLLGTRLLLLVPEFVKQERYLDACILELCALHTMQENEVNEFLFEMFKAGYASLIEESTRDHRTALAELGLTVEEIEGMSFDEMEERLAVIEADPVFRAKLEKLSPGKFDPEKMERSAAGLLTREDAQWLLLGYEELEPWLEQICAVLQTLAQKADEMPAAKLDDQEKQKLSNLLWDKMREAVRGIFVRERIDELIVSLRTYRDDLEMEGLRPEAAAVMGVMALLKTETEPGENYFLLTLCRHSVTAVLTEIEDETIENER